MERFWETEEWLNYLLNSKIGVEIIDHSFFMSNKFIPLVQEGQEFYSPGFDDDKKILQHIKELAQQYNIKRIQVNSQIKSYLNISGYTCILDLDNIKPSKGHRAAIKIGQKYLDYEISNVNMRFQKDYFKIAGKATRPDETFRILSKWQELGYGTLLKATYQGNTAGYVYLLHYGEWAYYFMGATFEEYKQYNVAHYLQSIAFDILRQKGIKTYELGSQDYNSLFIQPTAKERNISLFKRGFGGDIVINPISEYFFDKDYFKKTMLNRINNYIGAEYEQNNTILPET
jgi:hypothetical protein